MHLRRSRTLLGAALVLGVGVAGERLWRQDDAPARDPIGLSGSRPPAADFAMPMNPGPGFSLRRTPVAIEESPRFGEPSIGDEAATAQPPRSAYDAHPTGRPGPAPGAGEEPAAPAHAPHDGSKASLESAPTSRQPSAVRHVFGEDFPFGDPAEIEEFGGVVANVEPVDDGGAWFDEDALLLVPDAGAAVGAEGALSFWVEPSWDGDSEGDHSFLQLRDPQRWENRIQIFKNGPFLRFLFTDGSGTESGVGTDIKHWAAGERHHITATWADGMTYLYVDGVLAGTNPYPGELTMPGSTPLLLGSDHPGGVPGAAAVLGDFQAIDRELGADDVGARLGR